MATSMERMNQYDNFATENKVKKGPLSNLSGCAKLMKKIIIYTNLFFVVSTATLCAGE